LLGTMLVPLGLMPHRAADTAPDPADDEVLAARGPRRFRRGPKEPPLKLGVLTVARRDTDRLRQILAMQARLTSPDQSPRTRRSLMQRSSFADALTWLEIHGDDPEAVEHWRGFIEAAGPPPRTHGAESGAEGSGE